MFLKARADACRGSLGYKCLTGSSHLLHRAGESVSDLLGKDFILSKSTYIKASVFVRAEYAHLLPIAISSCIST